ncbi:acyl-CoA thioester hydrolase [Curtobacterium sp. PhB25]|uniref:acyl-CoA thioesterase n=1 Tax=unclassified Curtobacterium TaxID=257496 RepID=UPI00104FD349|nr:MULTISPECIES: thioesterase family protein [unclassified Curtobacterium]MBF4585884.1 acyl-CoA thioesterase [Curtobacterium sp. VKM Ac-2887]TCU50997.1 acyl-CoA thioester hydrolase [Curtobacterium sp. PhB146]TCU86669.1 acyl-CoA thioester hydrolase [Curtobacterium sp. PhB191]TDW73383.1 acyl-CoA thioester hydrolase [Curtobacterium sp. PhB25]
MRWSDIDAYGHVNNSAMLRLLEEARIVGFWGPDAGELTADGSLPEPIIDGRPGSGTMTVIAGQRLEYLASIPYLRQPLDIQMWIGRLGGASVDVSYEVWSPVGQQPAELYTRATTALVMVDAATNRPRRLTAAERAACEQYLEAPVEFSRP